MMNNNNTNSIQRSINVPEEELVKETVGTHTAIEKSEQDDRDYKLVTLPNKLQCLLISDPTTDKAAAAMDVRVGHLCDPETAPGLAHFLEHMLFMGTSKFPDENEYNVYLSSHGGSSNAYTDLEATNYHFNISADHYAGALDRFSQFFIAPLFLPSSTERELQAVDSEHAKNLQNDMWRSFQLNKSLCRKDHPYSKFGSGNLKTLKDLPNELGLDLRTMLLDFHKQYYSANIMKLVLLGKESLDELEELAIKYFSAIENKNIQVPQFPGKPYGPDELSKRLKIVPIRDGARTLDMLFPMRPTDPLYLYKPARYISHLIGHEGKGSILELLKKKGWANELSSGEGRGCSDWSSFSISIELTDAGMENIDDVVEIVFAYISLLKADGVKGWIYDECHTVASCQFRFLSKRNPQDYVTSLASAMQIYPGHHIISGPYKLYNYDPQMIQEFLNYLVPENMIVSITSKAFEGKTDQKEKWYGTEYNIEKLSPDICTKWSNANIDNAVCERSLRLPEMNDMIASDFAIKPFQDLPKDEPRLVVDTDRCRLWYKPDNVFEMPKVNCMILLRTTSSSTGSVEENVLATLWTQIVNEISNDFTYLASMASLNSSIVNGQRGIEMTVSGYNHKANVLLKRLVEVMKDVPQKLTQMLFDRVKDKISKEYKNFFFAQPYQHAFYAGDLCLEATKWSIHDKVAALEGINMQDVRDFSHRVLSRFYLELLVHGNVSVEEAKQFSSIILDEFKPMVPVASTIPQIRVVRLENRQDYVYRFKEPNENNTNSCIEVLFQIGAIEIDKNAILAVFHHLLKEPAFNELRTNEQLGYIVHSSIKTNGDNIKSLLILIQSDSYDPIYMDSRIEAFLDRLREKIVTMEPEEFQKNISAVSQSLREKNKNIGEESNKYWHGMSTQSYLFRRLQLIADKVDITTKDQVIQFYDEYILKGGPKRSKLSVQVYATQHMEKFHEPTVHDKKLITDCEEFKRMSDYYGLPSTPDISALKLDVDSMN
jgi:insulysin